MSGQDEACDVDDLLCEIAEDERSCLEDDACGEDDWLSEAETVEVPTLAPERPVTGRSDLAQTYNRIGGAMESLALEYGVDVAALLAVWQTESRALKHVPGKMIIRFENHLLRKRWGRDHPDFLHFFRVGEPPWKGHKFLDPTRGWIALHTAAAGQREEYAALAKATELAGETIALQCISMGGPQILGSNYALIGFDSPRAMYDAFQGPEDSHIRGCLNYCNAKKLLPTVQKGRLSQDKYRRLFAGGYNGPGQVDAYAEHLRVNFDAAVALLAGPRAA